MAVVNVVTDLHGAEVTPETLWVRLQAKINACVEAKDRGEEVTLRETFYVIHPLDDEPEEKRSPEGLGLMPMTGAVKGSLFVLRGYLVCMVGLVFWHVMQMGMMGH